MEHCSCILDTLKIKVALTCASTRMSHAALLKLTAASVLALTKALVVIHSVFSYNLKYQIWICILKLETVVFLFFSWNMPKAVCLWLLLIASNVNLDSMNSIFTSLFSCVCPSSTVTFFRQFYQHLLSTIFNLIVAHRINIYLQGG